MYDTREDIMMLARSLRSLLLAGAALTLAVAAQAAEPTTFTVTIKNVSTSETLKLPDGKTTNVPIAPGVYVVGARPSLLFAAAKPVGAAQAPRQPKPHTGASEHKPCAAVTARHDGFTYPAVAAVIEIEITPVAGMPPQS